MADIFTARKRSEIMSLIRSHGTRPELRLREIMCAAVGRRKLVFNDAKLPGCPDAVIPSLRVAVFADGCFYHSCPKHGHIPKSNAAYWRPKLTRNCRRDTLASRRLRSLGFHVWRVWEHDLKDNCLGLTLERLRRRVAKLTQEHTG